ncbi:hypothetical protein Pmani_006020 [Petrolisthes manimaculis]|uniref:Uncharacterized protein n=1 Tax=Petrolisthes manimaculis TaxID=1843537 RepID=A0AAE1QB18_9EUCA|nr:hypothetical protein Pmani_006020 [Petrolisthes manimaculis]
MKTDRIRIIWLWLLGMSTRTISLYSGASIRTVNRWVRRWQEEGHVENRTSQNHYCFPPYPNDTFPVWLTDYHSLSSFHLLKSPRPPCFSFTDEMNTPLNLNSDSALQWMDL